MGKKALAFLGSAAALIYIINPTAGVVEFIPDNVPFFGNIDEATATALLIWGVKTLFDKGNKDEPQVLDDQKH